MSGEQRPVRTVLRVMLIVGSLLVVCPCFYVFGALLWAGLTGGSQAWWWVGTLTGLYLAYWSGKVVLGWWGVLPRKAAS